MKQLTKILTMTLLILALNVLSFAGDFYIDAVNGDNAHSGTSTDDAWKTISHALTYVVGKEGNPAIIHVAEGTYNMALGETFPIEMKNYISLIGTNRENTIIDAVGSGISIFLCQYKNNFVIDNLTLTGGEGLESASGKIGGGLMIDSSSGKIEHCIIKKNSSYAGGGIIFLNGSSTIISASTIISNSASYGGAIFCQESSVKISDCIISDNTASVSSGGIYMVRESSPIINNCEIINNKGGEFCGGINCNENVNALINNCNIINNSGDYGGGIVCEDSSPTIKNCVIKENNSGLSGSGIDCSNASPNISDCIIENNSAKYNGGGINCQNSSPFIADCTISNNITTNLDGAGGGLMCHDKSSPVIINTLFWGNESSNGGCFFSDDSSPKFSLCTITGNINTKPSLRCRNNGDPKITSSIVWNNGVNPISGSINITYSNIEYGFEGEGNIDLNPQFITGAWGDYYLSQVLAGQDADSPCINAASEVPIMGFKKADYITRTDGVVDTGRVDMGYHYQPHVQFGLAINVGTGRDLSEGEAYLAPINDYNVISGNELNLYFSLITAPEDINADLYLILLDPDGEIHSGMVWDKGVMPLVPDFTLPANLDMENVPLLTFTLPSSTPPVVKPGTYKFYLAALKPGTVDFISNIATTSFTTQ